jgi:hypothetical protein
MDEDIVADGFRLFFLNSTGHIVRAEELIAMSAEEALAHAAQVKQQHGLEVWQRAKLLKRFEGNTSGAA